MIRLLHKRFAKTFGYFWIPCPLCGNMFGGHERHSKNSLMCGNIGKIVCKDCEGETFQEAHDRIKAKNAPSRHRRASVAAKKGWETRRAAKA